MSSQQRRLRLAVALALVAAGSFAPKCLAAQSDTTETPTWLLFVGTSNDRYDFGERHVLGHSLSVRTGVRLPKVDISLIGEHWRDWADIRMSSVLLEAGYAPLGRRPVSPFASLGLGYSWSERLGIQTPEMNGVSASFGAGVQVRLVHSAALRAEAVMRDDDGTFNGQLRFGVGYAATPPKPHEDLPRSGADVLAYRMAPVRGPWRFVEPGYVVRFSLPYSERVSGTMGLGVLHWQIEGQRINGNFLWDTRAFVGLPGVQLQVLPQELFVVRGGPAIIAMGEGPDAGANVGAHLEVASKVRVVGIPLLLGTGTFWMPRDPNSDRRIPVDEDQLGLTIFGGIRL